MKPSVLYVAGWGRGGTTILEPVLGSYDAVFAAGELHYLWRHGLMRGRPCGCGAPVRDCDLWREILDVAYGDDPPEPGDVDYVQRAIARVRHTRRALVAPPPSELLAYRDVVERLYLAIATVTGARVIVDSSRRPFGAALLTGMTRLTSYLVHVVRDPRTVTCSGPRPPARRDRPVPALMRRYSELRGTAEWLVCNGLTEQVAARFGGRHRLLRYEDFAARPRAVAEELLAMLAVPAEGGPFRDDRTVALGPGHPVSGGPGWFRTGEVTITVDEASPSRLPWRAQLVAGALSLPLRYRYGYL